MFGLHMFDLKGKWKLEFSKKIKRKRVTENELGSNFLYSHGNRQDTDTGILKT